MKSSFVRLVSSLVVVAAVVATVVRAAEPVKPEATLANLQSARQLDTAAKSQYEAFAAKATEEGYAGVARLFKGFSEAKSIRIAKYEYAIKALGGEVKVEEVAAPDVKTTVENIEAAMKSEKDASQTLSGFATQAEAGSDQKLVMVFKGSVVVSAGRIKLLESAAKDPASWKVAKAVSVCGVCGEVITDAAVKICPICSAPRSKFEVIE